MKILVVNCGSSSLKYQLIDSDSEAGKYASGIMAFPTTLIVDQDGNIVGEPIMGGLDNEDVMKEVQKTIDEIIENN